MENQQTISPEEEKFTINKENLTSFYKQELPSILKTVFLNPIEGIQQLFANRESVSYKSTLLLMLSVVALYFVAPYIMVGSDLRSYLSFGILLKFAVIVSLFMMVASALSFGIKSISGKPVFKSEMLTGALMGIGLILLLVVLFLTKLFVGNLDVYDLMNPSSMMDHVGFMMVFVIYIFLFMTNVMQQSLKASGTKDVLSWYLSPMAVLLAFYLTVKIAKGIFF
ncbi:MAG: hypothetical protein R2783_01705 [Gelidibacter sp.]